jgi:molybdopterin/thiamine biosynthesis adenylyltransferase
VFQGEGDDTRTCATSGVLASTTQIMGNLQAQAALTYLGLQKNALAQTLLLWQGQTMTLRKLKYRQDPNCPVCGCNTAL